MRTRPLATSEATDVRPKTSSLADVITTFVRAQHDLRPKTRLEYERSLRRFDAFMGDGTLADLTAATVNAYISSVVHRGARYLARNDAQTLRVFAKWLVAARILRPTP